MMLAGGMWRASAVHFGSEGTGRRWPATTPSDDPTANRQMLRVLIVEDELFVAMHLESVLEEIGYEVTGILSTGESAVHEFLMLQPDVILMDINLGSGIDGITAAQQIRAAGDVQIIFVSAYSDPATRARVESVLPGSKLLSKPVTLGSLKRAIQEQMRH